METPDTKTGLIDQPLFPMSETDRERLVRLETEGKAYEKRIARLEKLVMSGVGVIVVTVLLAGLALVLK